jgi:hypothetical protein
MSEVPRSTSSIDSCWCRVRSSSLSSCNVIDEINVGFIFENEFSLSKGSRERWEGVVSRSSRGGRTARGGGGCGDGRDTCTAAEGGTDSLGVFADDSEVRERGKRIRG